MNIPKPKKKANGTWIIQVMVGGKRQGKVFDTEKEAIAWAASVKAGITRQKKNPSNLTVGEAIDKYIEDGEAVYSPTTIMGYKKLRRNTMQSIMDIKLSNLTQSAKSRESDGARWKSAEIYRIRPWSAELCAQEICAGSPP